jgi:hypothetical protein
MKIPQKYNLAIALLLISGVVLAWGAMSLTVQNNAKVVIQDKNFAPEIIPVGSVCPVYGASVYSVSNSTITNLSWPQIVEPGTVSLLFCLENVGASTSAIFTQGTVNPLPSPGTLTVTPAGSVPILATGVTAITVSLTASTGVPASITGTTYSFSLTIA